LAILKIQNASVEAGTLMQKLALPRTRALRLLLAARKDIRPVPSEQRSRPGQSHQREVLMRGKLTGVHHLRNVFRRRKRGVLYARTLVQRDPLKRQTFKAFVIDTSLRPPRVVIMRSRDLLARFKRGQQSMNIYFKL
jgi:hypothetical protein